MNTQTVLFSNNDFVSPSNLLATTTAFFGGEIDLDPASSESANSVVEAQRYFDWKANGLKQDWKAKTVYLYPPRDLLNGSEQPEDKRLFRKKLRFRKSAQRVWLEKCYDQWIHNQFEQAIIFLTSSEVALLVTQKIEFDFPLCILAEHPKLLKETTLEPVNSRVFGFVYYLPPVKNADEAVRNFYNSYSNLGRVYT